MKSFFVKHKIQVTVVHDTTAREFVIYLWRVTATGLYRIKALPYGERSQALTVRAVAIAEAKRISETERGQELPS